MGRIVRILAAAAAAVAVGGVVMPGAGPRTLAEQAPAAAAAPADAPPVPFIRPKGEWDRFQILVWQYLTDAREDLDLYKQAGFHGFHIDRGAGKESTVAFAKEAGFPYYVDHAADKGYLHLTERTGVGSISRKKSLVPRPYSLADPKTLDIMKEHLRKNIAVTKEGPVLAYAFDDEVSLGIFNSPCEVDASPLSVAGYRAHLAKAYGTVERLNAEHGTAYQDFAEAEPVSFEQVRGAHAAPPFAKWNLARWMDWRGYMDTQFADCVGALARYANTLDPATPAGFVGGQQPAPYGGYDYAKFTRQVQWIEAYDINGTCEILRSLWKWPGRKPYVQTWFSTGQPRGDAWFLWYYLAHGCRGVIAWPDRGGSWFHWKGGGLAPFIAAGAETIREVQGDVSRPILDPDRRFDADPIALYYSHPSIQASWAMDAVVHGGTWPNRSSSLDNGCQTAARNRAAWMKLLEDCGYQYNVVTAGQVAAGALGKEKYRVLILDRAICLSDAEAAAIRAFAEQGGTVVADHLTGVLDEHGKGRATGGALDGLFGIRRDESAGYLDGKTIAEIDGEKYSKPLLERLSYAGALRRDGLVLYERGTRAGDAAEPVCALATPAARGTAVYLNLTPVAYYDAGERLGAFGDRWRDLMGGILRKAGLEPRAKVLSGGRPVPMAEVVWWRKGDSVVVGLVKNPTRDAKIDSAGAIDDVFGEPLEVTIEFARPFKALRDLRAGKDLPEGRTVRASWKPWEALLLEGTQAE